MATNWTKIKNEYINGNISYQELAKKHKVGYSALKTRAVNEKWFEQRKEQRKKISKKIEQKTAEKIAEAEANRMTKINAAADKLLEKIEIAIEQLDMYLLRNKQQYTQKITNPETGEVIEVFKTDETIKVKKDKRIDRAGLKQITSALKDLKDIQFVQGDEPQNNDTEISIVFETVTPEDLEDKEGDDE